MLNPALAIAVDVLSPNGDYTLSASHVHPEGLMLHTDLPLSEGQVLRLRVHTAEDPPPLIVLAVVRSRLSRTPDAPDAAHGLDVSGLGATASALLTLYHLTPYTRTRWLRWITWLRDRAHDAAWLPPASDASPDLSPDALHLRRLHRLLADARSHSRRASPRHALAWQVRLILAPPSPPMIEAHTANISEGGALITLPLDLPPSVSPPTPCEVVLYHPDDGAHLQVEAAIVRLEPPPPHAPARVAVRFVVASPEDAATLSAFIRSGVPPEERDDPLLLLNPDDLDSD